jgi:hypothetical protein
MTAVCNSYESMTNKTISQLTLQPSLYYWADNFFRFQRFLVCQKTNIFWRVTSDAKHTLGEVNQCQNVGSVANVNTRSE